MDLLPPPIRAFIRIVETGSALAAARSLGITQTAVTLRIRTLEESLGTSLFTRSARGMRPTAEGEVLYRYCQAVGELEVPALAKLRDLGLRTAVKVSVAAPSSIIRNRIIPGFASCTRKFPALSLACRNAGGAEATELLRVGQVQLAVLEHPEVAAEMDSRVLRPENYVLVAPGSWKRRPLAEVIRKERIIDYDPSDRLTLNYLKEFGLAKDANPHRHFVDSSEGVVKMLLHGLGYSAVTEETARSFIESGELCVLNQGRKVARQLAIAWYPRPHSPPYWKALIQAIR